MAIEPKSKEIGGATYVVTPMVATKGRKVFARLIKIAGPVLGKIAEAPPEGRQAALLAAIGAHVSEDDFEYFCDVFAPTTTVDGADLSKAFAVHFMGKYADMVEWVAFAVEVNFGDFFLALARKSPAPNPAKDGPGASP